MIKPLFILIGSFVRFFLQDEFFKPLVFKAGKFFSFLFKKRKEIVTHNLNLMGIKNNEDFFGYFFLSIYDFLLLPTLTRKKIKKLFIVKGEEKLRRYYKKEPVFLFTIHLSSWELGGAYLGLNYKDVYAFVERIRPTKSIFPGFVSFVYKKFREKVGITPIFIDRPFKLKEFLKRKGFLFILGDRRIKGEEERVKLFGKVWPIPKGGFELAIKVDAPCFFVYQFWNGKNYTGIIESLKEKGENIDYRELINRFVSKTEDVLKLHGKEWYVFEKIGEI